MSKFIRHRLQTKIGILIILMVVIIFFVVFFKGVGSFDKIMEHLGIIERYFEKP